MFYVKRSNRNIVQKLKPMQFGKLKPMQESFCKWQGRVGRYTLFKSKKHASPNNTQLVSMEGVFAQT